MRIRVHIHLFASLRIRNNSSEVELDLSPPCTTQSVLMSLGIPEHVIMVIMINGKRGTLDDPLTDGDELQLFPLLGGG